MGDFNTMVCREGQADDLTSQDKGEVRWNQKGEGKDGKGIIKSCIGEWHGALRGCFCS